MIDTDMAEQILQGDDTHPDILQALGLEMLAEVKRLQSEPTVTVDDYHKKGHLYVTVRFPDGDEYVGLVEKWEGEE